MPQLFYEIGSRSNLASGHDLDVIGNVVHDWTSAGGGGGRTLYRVVRCGRHSCHHCSGEEHSGI